MEITTITSKQRSVPSFHGLAQLLHQPELHYKVLNPKLSKTDILSFLTAVTSGTGFLVGGSTIIYDHFYDKKHKQKKSTDNYFTEMEKRAGQLESSSKDKKQHSEGVKTIVPTTQIAKVGLVFAKIGVAFSGIAGFMNGISMGLPMMSLGDGVNVLSSKIIETPLGLGLFAIGLASVFAGRALEADPVLRLDPTALANKPNFIAKSLYVADNIKNSALAVIHSAKLFGIRFIQLFSNSKKNSIQFFKDSVFSIKPKQLLIQEFIDREGRVIVKRALHHNPYLMHAASFILACGGALLTIGSLIKNNFLQKAGLNTYIVGGSTDNLSLSRWGLEKYTTAGNPATKLAGGLLAASGVTILSGQPGVDEKWGRGLMWAGTGPLFAVFAVERWAELLSAYKHKNARGAYLSLVRQWEVPFGEIFRGNLKEKIGPKAKQRIDNIIEAVNKNQLFHDPLLNKIEEAIRTVVQGKPFVKNSHQIENEIKTLLGEEKKHFKLETLKDLSDEQFNNILTTLRKQTVKTFGENPQIVRQA